MWIIYQTIVDESRVCHDLDQGSYIQGQCHKYQKPCPGHTCNSSLPCWILIIYYTTVSWPCDPSPSFGAMYCFICSRQRVAVTRYRMIYLFLRLGTYRQGQGHSLHLEKIVSGQLPFIGNLDRDDTSHNCCLSHRGCCSGVEVFVPLGYVSIIITL